VIASPCNKVCALDAVTGWCRGCGRTIGEIVEWGAADEDRQRTILSDLPDRLVRIGSDPASPASDDTDKSRPA
jgi:predicted Fe-S protein YdhL (DUF1289 family)